MSTVTPNQKEFLQKVIVDLREIKITLNQLIESKKYSKYVSMGFAVGGTVVAGVILVATGHLLPSILIITTMIATAGLSKAGLESLIYNREKCQLNNTKLVISNNMKLSDDPRYLDVLRKSHAKLFKLEQAGKQGNNEDLKEVIDDIIQDLSETMREI